MSIRKSISFTFGAQIINTLIAFITSVIITRILGTAGWGEYAIYTNAISLAIIWLGFGLPSSIIYYASGDRIDGGKMFTTLLWVCFATTLVLAFSLQFLFTSNSQWLIFPNRYQGNIWQAIFILQFFLYQVNNALNAFLIANKVFIPQAIFTVVLGVLSILLWLALYFKLIPPGHYDFSTAITVLLIFTVPPVIYNFYLLKTKTGISFTYRLLAWPELRKMLKFALLIYGCHTLQNLNYKMDLWIVDYYRGKSEVGIYSLAVQLAQLVWILPNVMTVILYSYISNNHSLKEATDMALKYARWAFYATIIIAGMGYVIFYFAIPMVYSAAFQNARTLIPILFAGIVPFSMIIIFGSFVAGTNRLFINFIITVISCIITTILYFILIPKFGAVGASIATSVSYLCTLVLFFGYLYFIFEIKKTQVFTKAQVLNDLKIFKAEWQKIISTRKKSHE